MSELNYPYAKSASDMTRLKKAADESTDNAECLEEKLTSAQAEIELWKRLADESAANTENLREKLKSAQAEIELWKKVEERNSLTTDYLMVELTKAKSEIALLQKEIGVKTATIEQLTAENKDVARKTREEIQDGIRKHAWLKEYERSSERGMGDYY